MLFVCYIFFPEMAPGKWIVLFAFLTLFTFIVEVRSSSVTLEEVIQLLQKSVTALEKCNYNCTGKSPNKIHKKNTRFRFADSNAAQAKHQFKKCNTGADYTS